MREFLELTNRNNRPQVQQSSPIGAMEPIISISPPMHEADIDDEVASPLTLSQDDKQKLTPIIEKQKQRLVRVIHECKHA